MENDDITMTKKILLVDDEPDLTYTIKKILEDNEYKADSFNDSILALISYKKWFLWFDNSLYNDAKNGWFELYTKIREQDPKVKICFLTVVGTFNEEFRKIRLALGKTINEDYFIQKPIETENLVKKLTSIMNIK